MKKIFAAFGIVLLLTGCSLTKDMDNTPTKKVETFLNNYQTLSSDVVSDLNSVVETDNDLTDEQKELYKDIIKSNYQKMTYTIKDTKEDGDEAIVTAEIEVVDYSTILSDVKLYLQEHAEEFMTNNEHDPIKYNDYKLEKIKSAKEKVKYTIDFSLTKIDDEWQLDELTKDSKDKINGIYEK